MKIGNYEIKRLDNNNLQLIKHIEREIRTQQVADMMNKKEPRHRQEASVPYYKVGDVYNAIEEIGFYPVLEMALHRILDEDLLSFADDLSCFSLVGNIEKAKNQITKAVERQTT